MLGNEHKLSWVSKHVGAKSNRPFLAALLIAVFFVLTRRRPDEGSGVVDTARDVRKVAEMVRRSKDSLVLDSWRERISYLVPVCPPSHTIGRSPTHAPTHPPTHPRTHAPTHAPTYPSSSSFSSCRTRRPSQRGKRWQTNNARFCFRARSTRTRRTPWRIPSPRSLRRALSGA